MRLAFGSFRLGLKLGSHDSQAFPPDCGKPVLAERAQIAFAACLLGMESADYCRERAEHYRRMALESGSQGQHFEELARQYQKLAEAIEADERDGPEAE